MFKGTKLILGLLVAGGLLQSCQDGSDYKTLDSGLQYRFIKQGDGPQPEEGQVMTMHMTYGDDVTDSVFFDSKDHGYPVPIQVGSNLRDNPGGIEEIFKMLKKGDSIQFKVLAENLFEKTFEMELPEEVQRGSMIRFNIGVVDVMSEDDYRAWQREEYEKEMERLAVDSERILKEDIEKIDEYLKENQPNAKVQTTESGIRYIVTQAGKGASPQAGNTVEVHYKGTLLDGKMFDSSYERGKPIEFPLGQGQVIQGWDEGISLLSKGSKATFYIPSPLAYGPQSRGAVIGPNSILVFDVELVDFKK
jgi:FKBP-type peptidyl-prolyl cis-trans isomerase FkpA